MPRSSYSMHRRSVGQIQDTTPDPLPRAIAPNANGQSPEVSAATVARRRGHHSAEWRLIQARPPLIAADICPFIRGGGSSGMIFGQATHISGDPRFVKAQQRADGGLEWRRATSASGPISDIASKD